MAPRVGTVWRHREGDRLKINNTLADTRKHQQLPVGIFSKKYLTIEIAATQTKPDESRLSYKSLPCGLRLYSPTMRGCGRFAYWDAPIATFLELYLMNFPATHTHQQILLPNSEIVP